MNLPHFPLTRRAVLGTTVALGASWSVQADLQTHRRIDFPRDHGAHPDFRTEWWYITGYTTSTADSTNAKFGFQITFFRSQVPHTQHLQSNLAAKQLIFAHAAITDVQGRKLWHDQRIARSSGKEPGMNAVDSATCSTQDASIVLKDWSLRRMGERWHASVRAAEFSMNLHFTPLQETLLQGQQGWSRKGPDPAQTSHYYSLPHLQVQGELSLQGQRHEVRPSSVAWLDHEWSQEMLHPLAIGWDWIGINLFDGSALTAFQVRDKNGLALWDGGSFRKGSDLRSFERHEARFTPRRFWQSPRSQTRYPVEWSVRTPLETFHVVALVDDQELDSRTSTGAIYWEGLCEVRTIGSKVLGRGYLEMTGYASALRL